MKNLKTIITLLVLTVTMFSCQTNDELVELEILQKNESSNITIVKRQGISESVEILVHFKSGVAYDEIRSAFMQHPDIDFLNWESCLDRVSTKETWTIQNITYKDFFSVAEDLGYGNSVLTGLSSTNDDDDDPVGGVDYAIYYNANCFTLIN